MAYVYIHRRLTDNKVFYVGIGNDKNYKRAKSSFYRNKHWKHVANKHGFKHEIVWADISIESARILEIQLISKYGRKIDGGILCNMTKGGEGSHGLGYLKYKPVSAYDLSGMFVKTFPSINAAATFYHTSHAHIIQCAKGRTNYCKRLQWRYGSNKNKIAPVSWNNKIKHRRVAQYDLNNRLVEIHNSISEACKKLGIKKSANIYQCLNNKRASAFKFKWKTL